MSVSVFDMVTMQHLWSTPELREIFSEQGRLQSWLDFEAALAKTQADLGIIPSDVADQIVAACRIGGLDLDAIAAEVRRVKHTLVPLLREVQKDLPGEAGEFLHYGATTQDVVDTGTVLQLRRAHAVYQRDLSLIGAELLRLAETHRETLMVGRTHGVQALPITFGHKAAIWLDEVARHAERLEQAGARVFVVMVVGAVGSQASFGPQARAIEEGMARELGLGVPDVSWAPARDRLVEYTSLLALISGTLGKIGRELFNMQRNEFAEVEEGFSDGKLGSSTMPHKRNPVAAENVAMLSRSVRYSAMMMLEAMVHEHERDGIAWKSEWKALPETCLVMGAQMFQTIALLRGLQVAAPVMARNLEMMRGYLLSENVMLELGRKVGKNTAHEWLYEASMRGLEAGQDFGTALAGHAEISKALTVAEIETATRPDSYLGTVGEQVDRVVARHRDAAWLKAAAK